MPVQEGLGKLEERQCNLGLAGGGIDEDEKLLALGRGRGSRLPLRFLDQKTGVLVPWSKNTVLSP